MVSLSIFPAMLSHMFGETSDRGMESFQNLHSGMQEYWNNLKAYFGLINENLFGHLVPFFFFLGLFFIIYQVSQGNLHVSINWDTVLDWVIVSVPSISYFLLVSKIAVMTTDRYVMPIYALVLLWGTYGIYSLLKKILSNNDKLAYGAFMVILSVMIWTSWKGCHWEYLFLYYKDLDAKIAEYQDLACLYVSDGFNSKIFTDYMEVSQLKSATYFEGDVSALADMAQLQSQPEFILYTVDVNAEEVINQIKAICPQIYTYEQIGSKNHSTIWHLTNDFSVYAEEKISQLKNTTDLSEYLVQMNDRCLSYCIQIKEGSIVYSDDEILDKIKASSNYKNLELLDDAILEQSNYFTVIDNGWQDCWETIDRVNLLSVGELQKIPCYRDLIRSFFHSLLLLHCFVKCLPAVPGSPAFSGCLYSGWLPASFRCIPCHCHDGGAADFSYIPCLDALLSPRFPLPPPVYGCDGTLPVPVS